MKFLAQIFRLLGIVVKSIAGFLFMLNYLTGITILLQGWVMGVLGTLLLFDAYMLYQTYKHTQGHIAESKTSTAANTAPLS